MSDPASSSAKPFPPAPESAETAAELWAQAQARFGLRDYDGAADLLGGLIAEHDGAPGLNMAAVRLQYGVTLLRLRRTPEGVEQLRHAVELDPGNPRIHQKLGAGLARLGHDAAALPHLERAAAMAPEKSEYQWRVGEQYRRLRRAAEARAAFDRALKLDPGYLAARDGLEKLKRRKGGWLVRLARVFKLRR